MTAAVPLLSAVSNLGSHRRNAGRPRVVTVFYPPESALPTNFLVIDDHTSVRDGGSSSRRTNFRQQANDEPR